MPAVMVQVRCEHCGKKFPRRACEVAERRRCGRRTFCGHGCAGAARRKGKTQAQKRAEKAAYDRKYREKNLKRIKAYKAAWFQRTYDPEKARKLRTPEKMAAHVEYCRRYYADPTKKAEKVAYDEARRSAKYGPFAEAHRLLVQLKKAAIKAQPDKYERAKARGYYERNAQQRRRDAQISRW